jgi:ABC-2 type transport system ATP-binding protein
MISPVIEFKDGSKKFRKRSSNEQIQALSKLNFCVEAGEIYGFLGLNGAGKTTAIKCVLGLSFLDSGTVKVFDSPSSNLDLTKVGFAPEIAEITPYLSALEFLQFATKLSGKRVNKDKLISALANVGLQSYAMSRAGDFSKGMKQRLSIAAAISHEPDLIIFDEPTSGLDPIGRMMLKKIIRDLKANGKTVFFSTHILSDIEELCDRVGVIDNGSCIFEGSPSDLKISGKTLEESFVTLVEPENDGAGV